MSLISGYGSSSDEESSIGFSVKLLNPAPDVSLEDSTRAALIKAASSKELAVNVSYDDLSRPDIGPVNPYTLPSSLKQKNIITGYAEEQAFDDITFKTQQRTFQTMGYALDPSNNNQLSLAKIVGDTDKALLNDYRSVADVKISKKLNAKLRSKRQKQGDPSVLDGENSYKGPWASYNDTSSSSSGDSEAETENVKILANRPIKSPATRNSTKMQESTEFYGKELYDYLGRSYMHIPRDLDINLLKTPGEQECFIPKRKIHTWHGHVGGVSALKFFPKSGHLLLSSGHDAKIKIWDCYHKRELLRSYSGHTKTVKDICFSNDGTKFLSTSYDSMMKLWDTETGQCIARFTTGRTGNCIKFNPDEDKQNEFIAGMSNNKLIQFDVRTDKIVQEYDHHTGPVNTVTFIDENRRFISTSDDKSLRVWEWQINVPIKIIADPMMHSLPAVQVHPNGRYIAAQSMDNKVLVYGATDRFRQNHKKIFTGHTSAGYGIEVNFSPDGKTLMSGDVNGYAYFWDWKTSRLKSKFKAHESSVLCIVAHPQETSKVATAGLDSDINYWD
ncbi:WD40 repeat-like protein [Nadsonia fulvescens var. elongata DSM 6958]|uniref:Pre-mRNA-processing factor 17 n=1 Tax=Nadsonia fulvescens var. elongata DSM 6958 TaxID=857566 RepID=A0A1E3PHZ4_9ASCO|nr:WD40 repeat-like protein [Nadsonia fulvescens var. elongata DSM 6958]